VSFLLDNLSRLLGLHSLKQRLRFWVGAIIITLGAMILISTTYTEVRSKTSETNQHLRDTIGLQKTFIERWLDDHSMQIGFLSGLLSGPPRSEKEISGIFDTFITSEDEFRAVVYVNADAITVVDTEGPPGLDVSEREYFQAAKEGKSFVTDIIIGKSTGKPIVLVSSPVLDEAGNFNGLVFGTIHIEVLDKLMNQFDFGSAGSTYLLDRGGRFITRPVGSAIEPLTLPNRSDIFNLARQGVMSDKAYDNYTGERVIGQYSWTKDNQWLIVGEIQYASVFKPLYTSILLMALIVLAVLVVNLALAFKLTQGVERPIRLLLTGTKIMRDGNYDYRIPKEEILSAPVELQQLCDTFNATSQRLKSTIQMLEQTAVVDQLTEVYNRRYMMSEGQKLLEACIREKQPASVLMMDIDYFKRVNDTYGHLLGDRVIIYAASVLLSCIRTSDMVSRYGGEEFLILAPHADAGEASRLGESIRRHFMDNPYREEGVDIQLTVSIGVADYRQEASYGISALEDMISRADQALYQAKHKGRNRVEILDQNLINT
jgi:two-component system, cell cycle response regulator